MRSVSTNFSASSWLNCNWNRWRKLFTVCTTPAAKQGILDCFPINSTSITILSADLRRADAKLSNATAHILSRTIPWNACLQRPLNSSNGGDVTPPSTSIYSCVNLKGAASKPTEPGELDSMKPKSIWIMSRGLLVPRRILVNRKRNSYIRPWSSIKMFPLCRSLSWKT